MSPMSNRTGHAPSSAWNITGAGRWTRALTVLFPGIRRVHVADRRIQLRSARQRRVVHNARERRWRARRYQRGQLPIGSIGDGTRGGCCFSCLVDGGRHVPSNLSTGIQRRRTDLRTDFCSGPGLLQTFCRDSYTLTTDRQACRETCKVATTRQTHWARRRHCGGIL